MSDIITRTVRNMVGATVQLPHDWFIDGNFLYGESDFTENIYNSINKSRLQEALNGTLPGLEGNISILSPTKILIHPNSVFYPALRTQQFENRDRHRPMDSQSRWYSH